MPDLAKPAAPAARPVQLPDGASCYRMIGPFDEKSLPAGLRQTHRLKADCWGLFRVLSGSVTMVWEDETGGVDRLTAPQSLVVPPQCDHHVEGDGPFEVEIEFNRVEDA